MNIERIWAMPNWGTFTIKPIRELLDSEIGKGIWLDPFCGRNSPVEWKYCNDLDIEMDCKYHTDALEWLQAIRGNFADGILYDPPYSITQARKHGKGQYANKKYWSDCKAEIGRIIKQGGKAICFGWNSGGIGLRRGFNLERVLLVPHGGGRNDTIVTMEVKE